MLLPLIEYFSWCQYYNGGRVFRGLGILIWRKGHTICHKFNFSSIFRVARQYVASLSKKIVLQAIPVDIGWVGFAMNTRWLYKSPAHDGDEQCSCLIHGQWDWNVWYSSSCPKPMFSLCHYYFHWIFGAKQPTWRYLIFLVVSFPKTNQGSTLFNFQRWGVFTAVRR